MNAQRPVAATTTPATGVGTPTARQGTTEQARTTLVGATTRHSALRLAAVCALYTALALVFTWPLALHLDRGLISALDPLDSAWRLAQAQNRLLHDPGRLLDANIFYPYARTYLFDELLLGAAVLTLPLRLFTANPVLIYNVAVLATLVANALAMHALARRLNCHTVAATVAGISYAFAPFRLDHLPHLGLLSGQYFPLIILILDQLWERPSWRKVPLLALVLALQAYSAQYYALYLGFVVGGFVALRLLLRAVRRERPRVAPLAQLAVAGALAALLFLPLALNYRAVQSAFGFERSLAENVLYSANLSSFLTADERNRVWGEVTKPLRSLGRYSPERNLFPGAAVLLLAAAGAATAWRRPLPGYLILLGLGGAILALGPGLYLTADPQSQLWGRMPYGFFYTRLPGFDSMRVPARFNILYGLGVAALAGVGCQWLLARLGRWHRRRTSHLARGILALCIALPPLAVAAESATKPYGIIPIPTGEAVPAVYTWLAAQPDAVLAELPLQVSTQRAAELLNNRYQYFALYHGRPVVNGAGNVVPKGYRALALELADGPNPRALAILQGLGVTHLVVHYAELTPEGAARTRAALHAPGGAATLVASFGDDVVYRLAPADRFAQLRATIPPDATIYLSREDPTGAYGGLLARVLRENPFYTRVRVEYGREYQGAPDPAMRYDYAILYRQEDPASVGFAGATVVWEDEVVRVYRRE